MCQEQLLPRHILLCPRCAATQLLACSTHPNGFLSIVLTAWQVVHGLLLHWWGSACIKSSTVCAKISAPQPGASLGLASSSAISYTFAGQCLSSSIIIFPFHQLVSLNVMCDSFSYSMRSMHVFQCHTHESYCYSSCSKHCMCHLSISAKPLGSY